MALDSFASPHLSCADCSRMPVNELHTIIKDQKRQPMQIKNDDWNDRHAK